jgi:hypothetical protein
MSIAQPAEWAKNLQAATEQISRSIATTMEKAGAELATALEQATRISRAQAAMGWAYRGGTEALEKLLRMLPRDQLADVPAAAVDVATTAEALTVEAFVAEEGLPHEHPDLTRGRLR